MTPDALRRTIASARRFPRMHAETPSHLATLLYGMVCGVDPGDGRTLPETWRVAVAARCGAPVIATDAEACDVADRVVAALWQQGADPAPFATPDGDECFRTGDDAGRLLNLLAVIHRDGGHHTEDVGVAQSCCDAASVVLAAIHAGDAPAQPVVATTRECPQCGSDGWRDNPSHACPECATPFRPLAQPGALDFYAALAAVRNGRFVSSADDNTDLAQVAALASPVRSAAWMEGEAFARENPEAAGRILG